MNEVEVLPRLLRAKEVADATGESVQRVYFLARTEQMPSIRLGRSMRFSQVAVREWLERGGTGWEPGSGEGGGAGEEGEDTFDAPY